MSEHVLDNLTYIERRFRAADEAEARLNALAAQGTRRFIAIEQAIRQVRALGDLVGTGEMEAPAVSELLGEIALHLEEANRMRATDMEVACA